RQRRLGYERALAEAGLPVEPSLVIGDSWDPTTVDAGVDSLCQLDDPPTAVFAANDNLAFRAIGVLHMSGRRVPDDVALVGFDDIPLAHEMVPPLTTMRIPLDEIGRRASERLRRLTTEGRPSTGEADLIVPYLVQRATA